MEEVRFQCRHVSCWSGKPAANSGIWTIYIHLPGTKRSFPLPKSDPLLVFFCGSRLLFRLKNSPSEEMFQPTLQDQAGVQPVWQDALMFDDDDVQSDFVGKQRRKTLWRTSINSSIPKLKRFKTWSIFQRLHPSASRLLQLHPSGPFIGGTRFGMLGGGRSFQRSALGFHQRLGLPRVRWGVRTGRR